MKKAIYHDCCPHDMPLNKRFELVARAGFDGLELGDQPGVFSVVKITGAEIAKLRKLSEKTVAITDVWFDDMWTKPLTHPDPAVRKNTLEGTKKAIQITAELGGKSVLVVPGHVNEEVSHGQAWERSIAAIHELLPVAQKHGIKIGIETVWNKFLLSPREFREYLKEIGSPDVGIHFDTTNVCAWSYPWHWVEEVGDLFTSVHVAGCRANQHFWGEASDWVSIFESDFDWKKVMLPLHKKGYAGWLIYDRNPYGAPYHEKGVHLMSKELDYLLSLK